MYLKRYNPLVFIVVTAFIFFFQLNTYTKELYVSLSRLNYIEELDRQTPPEEMWPSLHRAVKSFGFANHATGCFFSPNFTRNASTRYISAYASGRLGNQLFLIASAYGIGKRLGFTPVMPDDDALLQDLNFGGLVKVLPVSKLENLPWQYWTERAASIFDEQRTCAIADMQQPFLDAYLQSFKYFKGFEYEIVQHIQFTSSTQEWANRHLKLALRKVPKKFSKNYTLVGVHARRGDYLRDYNKRLGYKTAPEAFFHRATQHFLANYSFVVFVVCSNEFKWVVRVFNPSAHEYERAAFYFVEGHESEAHKDMYLLSLLNHSIISTGTFSFWAAMLRQFRRSLSGSGTTIAYAHPFFPGTLIAYSYGNRLDDFYPPDWILME